MLIGSTIATTGFTSMGGDMTDALWPSSCRAPSGCAPSRAIRSGSLIEREFRRVVLGNRSISKLVKLINEAALLEQACPHQEIVPKENAAPSLRRDGRTRTEISRVG